MTNVNNTTEHYYSYTKKYVDIIFPYTFDLYKCIILITITIRLNHTHTHTYNHSYNHEDSTMSYGHIIRQPIRFVWIKP